ncbi:MAG: OmpA family protein [Salinivirgaceae bacterium]|jgi:outer membrane protein OmpA-like peptidoglycan-associated protein/tetratricopeptide (TPR) repeat protein|nr:OmpA family protein [Salinivirgaceae bacterium]
MKKILITLLAILFTTLTYSQDKKEVKALFKDAEMHLLYEEYDLALPIYLELINKGWDNANIQSSIGMCYMYVQQVKLAIPYFKKAILNTSPNFKEGNYKEDRAPEEAWFFIAKAYRIDGQLDKAIEAYTKYKSLIPVSDTYMHPFLDQQLKSCETAKNLINSPVNYLSTLIEFNEEGDNFFPAVSGDEKSMVFTAYQEVRDPDYGTLMFDNIKYAKNEAGVWGKAKDLTSEIASDGYISTAFLSYSGDFMILRRNDYGNDNLYYSELEGRKWSEAKRFAKKICGKDNETHGSITKDASTLYFVSDRAGGYGQKDIWYSSKSSKGKWESPKNLGDIINTPFIEEAVFIGEDGKTIYFASEGHNSMGGFDIFKSTQDAGGQWSEPQNIGYPINTTADDRFYMPIGDGSVAYYARNPESGGEKRIYRIEFPETERVVEVVADNIPVQDNGIDTNSDTPISETTTETTTEEPAVTPTKPEVKKIIVPSEYELNGSLKLQDNKELDPSFYIHVAKPDGEVIAALSPNVATGEFRTKIKFGSYVVKAFGDGYETAEKYIYISEDQQNTEVLTFLEMIPKEVSSGEYYTIKSVLFDYNSAELNRDAQIEIERLATLMGKNPSLYIEVIGNADALGTEEYNQQLSIRRARSVVDYIKNKDIDQNRFVAKGLGKSNFVAINHNPDGSDNPEGRKLNRRVDMKVIKSTNEKITTENIYVPDELRYKEFLTYTIFLMETEEPLKPSYFNQSGEDIANVWMFRTEVGYMYTVGKFSHQSEALTLMNVVVDAGFPDARVINNIKYNELVTKSSNFFKSKMVDTDKKVYTIQLYALKKPIETTQIKGLTEIEVVQIGDGYYRYIWGEFIGKTSAHQALADVMQKGYYDAFVVEMEKYHN